ncbi:hypothetical protein HY408_01105 [Candidatus Gottesmanbacteria bacterium]|nr:hypothetical protein [Candidatus Gottesmanbacteria bacterium]
MTHRLIHISLLVVMLLMILNLGVFTFSTALGNVSRLKLNENYLTLPQLPLPSPQVIPSLPTQINPFGVMIPSQAFSDREKMQMAKDLGVRYYRPLSLFVDRWNGRCSECDAALNEGLKLVLTIRNGGGNGEPSYPPTNIPAFKLIISRVLETYQPEVLVVENEENSLTLFYSGTPEEYHAELAAACEVAHEKNTKCTNGGLVSSLVAYLTAEQYREQGEPFKAREYLRRTLDPEEFIRYEKSPDSPRLQLQIRRGQELLAGYAQADADFVNFHWYIEDTDALNEAVDYLEETTGLPALTNEVGQQENENPLQVINTMKKITQLDLPIAVWFSHDTEGFGGSRSLFNPDGTLRPNGIAFKEFIQQKF